VQGCTGVSGSRPIFCTALAHQANKGSRIFPSDFLKNLMLFTMVVFRWLVRLD
jgi:hypothetical protein